MYKVQVQVQVQVHVHVHVHVPGEVLVFFWYGQMYSTCV